CSTQCSVTSLSRLSSRFPYTTLFRSGPAGPGQAQMFIPLHDANRLKHIKRQYVTLGIIGLNVFVWAAMSLGGNGLTQAAALGLGARKSSRLNSSHVKSSYAVFCCK